MLNMNELWLAFAGDKLTCKVTVNRGLHGCYVEIDLSGMITPACQYIYDLLVVVMNNAEYDTVFINAKNLILLAGHTVNDCAVEQLLKIVCYFSDNDKDLHLSLEDGCVNDVIKQSMPRKKYCNVRISDNRAAAFARSCYAGN